MFTDNPSIEEEARKRFYATYRETFGVDDDEEAKLLLNLWECLLIEVTSEFKERDKAKEKKHHETVFNRVAGILVQISPSGVWHTRRFSKPSLTFCGLEIPAQGFKEKNRKDQTAKPHCFRCGASWSVMDSEGYQADKAVRHEEWERSQANQKVG